MPTVNRNAAELLIRERGAPELIQQLDEGMLAPELLDDIARDILFQPIAWADPYRKVPPHSVRRVARDRGLADEEDTVSFDTLEADSLSPAEYKTLQALRKALPEAQITPMWTIARCGQLEQKHPKARVVVEFGGRPFVREVALLEIPCAHCGANPSEHAEAVNTNKCFNYWAGEKGSAQREYRRRGSP